MRLGRLFSAVLLAVAVLAQTGTGTITGVIRDVSGAAIPGTHIRIINEGTGVAAVLGSNESGVYRASSLAPGSYRVEVEAHGFDRLIRRTVGLQVSQVLALDLTLQVGSRTETVQVTEAAPLLDSQSSNAGQFVGRRMVEGLALPNRAATSLVTLAPGIVMIDNGSGTAENYPVFSVAGGRARNQNFTLDGGNVTNAVGLTRPMQLTSLPMDAMQEFRVISNNYTAENGHSTGGVIELSTRSGTNAWHGSLFDYVRHDALDARNFFSENRAPIRLHQFGGSMGGPVRKDKTHYFVTWEQTRQITGQTVLQTVPDAAQRLGDFSNLRDAAGRPVLIYDPGATRGGDREPFQNNVIPASRFDPVARAALAYWPLPNRAASASGLLNFGANAPSRLHRNIVVGRLDHHLSNSDQLTARYYINDSAVDNRGSYGRPESDPNADLTEARIQSILGSHTHLFRPSLVNELRLTYLRRKFIDERYGLGQNLSGAIGLAGVSPAAFPALTLPGYASLGGNVQRIQTPITDTQILEALSWFRGKHALKFGFEHRRGFNNEKRDRYSSGNFAFTPLITSRPGVAGTGDSLASFVLGEVNAASVLFTDQIPSRAYYAALYAQDEWRLTDRLTLNYGLRWETELPRRVDGDRQNSFDPEAINPVSGTPGVVTFSGRNGAPRQAFRTDWNNFGPRFGFAYRLRGSDRTVVRGGAGVFYGPTVSNSIGDAASLGFSTSVSLVVSQADRQSALLLRSGFPGAALMRPPLDASYGAVALGQRPSTAIAFFDPDRPTPISYQYTLSVQHEVRRDLLLEAGYLANISHHLTANDLSLNQVRPELLGAGDAQSRRPFPQFSNISSLNPAIGNSTYHSGFVKAEKRFGSGFSFLAHFTFSKFLDDVAAADEYGDPASYMDAYNRRLDKSRSGSDVPYRTVLSILYEVPALKNHRLAAAALGGWKIGGLATLQSGALFTVVTAANTTNAFPAGPLRPDLLRDPSLPSGERTLKLWFDTLAFAQPPAFRFGNSPRDGLRGPGLQNVDLTLLKELALTERFHADLRAEAYNLINHANFDLPGHTFGTANFAAISSARAARSIQLGLRLSF